MAMAAITAAVTSLHAPSQLQQQQLQATARYSPAAFSPRASVAVGSGFNGILLRSISTSARSTQSRRLSIKALITEVDTSKVVPQADRVLVRLEKVEEQSAGGVLLPKSAVKFERYLVGEIIAAGAEVTNVEKGQKVLFPDTSAYEVNLGTSDRLCFCRASDLLAILN